MRFPVRLHLDLGLRALVPQWRALLAPVGLAADGRAALAVAAVSLPLSLAIAFASGVPPFAGLLTAVLAGGVCALGCGTELGISGPTLAMALLVASIVQQHGTSGLLLAGLAAGVLQVLSGALGLGRLGRYVPAPVVAGLGAGIAFVVLVGQVPSALGLPPPDASHVLDVVLHLVELGHRTNGAALALAALTVAIALVLPRYSGRLPAPLVALLVPSLLAHALTLPVAHIGALPHTVLWAVPRLPAGPLTGLLGACVSLWALASLESLMAATAVAKLVRGQRPQPDQDLIGQGLGNVVVALAGGLPATGVLARSALNVVAGAVSRRAALLQALLLAAVAWAGGAWVAKIPIPVLAGIVVAVALRMVHPRQLRALAGRAPVEAATYGATFCAVVLVDMLAGVQAGLFVALGIAALRLSRTRARVQTFGRDGAALLHVDGPLTFLNAAGLDGVRRELAETPLPQGLIVDLAGVTALDGAGAAQLLDIVQALVGGGTKVALKGASEACRRILTAEDPSGQIAALLADNEPEARAKVEGERRPGPHLAHGVEKFRATVMGGYGALFRRLADKQAPHTLFITCSDSRIDPNLITSTGPGELFIVRNVGNVIPAFGSDARPAEGAAVEFAVGVLGVQDIVVCGHSGCGAMKAILSGDLFTPDSRAKFPSLSQWLSAAAPLRDRLTANATPAMAATTNALGQLDSLRTYPMVRERLEAGTLRLHAWYYDIGEARLQAWDPESRTFCDLGVEADRALGRRVEAGVHHQPNLAGPLIPPEG